MAVTFSGTEACMRWAYHTAARLGAWTLTMDPEGGALTAKVVTADTFKLSQPALTFTVIRQKGPAMKWPVSSLHIADQTLTARVGPQE